VIHASSAYVSGWKAGYRIAARHSGWRPGLLLATALFIGALSVGASLAFLWASASLWGQYRTGEPVSKTVITKGEAWKRGIER